MRETEPLQIDPDLMHLPQEQQMQIMKQRKTYEEDLASYNHLQDSIKNRTMPALIHPTTLLRLKYSNVAYKRGYIPKKCLRRGMS